MKVLITCLLTFSLHLVANSQLFKEASNAAGLDYIYPGNDYQEVGAGVTVFDVNNDGWDDLFQAGGVFHSKLWINEQGTFRDATSEFGLDSVATLFIQASVAGDFDNDGYEDLFICNMGESMFYGDNRPPVLLKNMNGKSFEVIHEDVFSKPGNYTGAAWGDYNNDGFIDLFVLSHVYEMGFGYNEKGIADRFLPDCRANQLYLNKQGKGFEDISQRLGLNDEGCGLAVLFTDYDNDSDLDLIMLNDFGEWSHKGNKLYRNEFPEDKFTDISKSTGLYEEFYGMGVGPGDYNNDGYLDYYFTNIGRNYFYENKNGKFSEIARPLNIDITYEKKYRHGTSWSGIFFDMENDGDVDLYVNKGFINTLVDVVVVDPNKLYRNNGDGTFEDISTSSGMDDSLSHRGAVYLDYDHDGDIDVISSVIKMRRGEFGGIDQKIKLYENQYEGKNNWIGIKLSQESGNTSCIGCSVSFELDGKKHIREVDGGSAHNSQSTRILYFGLGKSKVAKNISIDWLGGKSTSVDQLKNGKVYEIKPDGSIKVIY